VTTLPLAVQHQSFILFSLGGTSWGVVAGFPGTLPANSLLGTGGTAGIAGVIPSSTFATPASLSAAIASLVNSSPAVLDTLGKLAAALGNDPNFVTTITNSLALKANLNSPALVTPNLGTPSAGVLTNATGLPLTGTTGTLPMNRGGTGSITQNFVDLTTTQTVGGSKTFLNPIIVGGGLGSGLGFIRLTNGGPGNSGYLEIFKGGSDTRLGYIGYDNTNLGYAAEGTAKHSFWGDAILNSSTQSTSTTTGAQVIAGGQAIGGNLNVGGFTSLGDNVAIKKKYLTGITAGMPGGAVGVVHGLTESKIINFYCCVVYASGCLMPTGHSYYPGYYFDAYLYTGGSFIIINHPTSSEFILSKEIRIVVEYIA
jgi:hypothetical protein